MRILIDARKAFDSGIGTYIRCVVPRVIARMGGVSFSILVEPGGSQRHHYLAPGSAAFVEIADAPLGVKEQASLRRVVKQADLFWATSLAHPLFGTTPVVATVHDVAQLATASHAAADLVVKAAASVYFSSLRKASRLLLFNSAFTKAEFLRCVGEPRSSSLVTPLGVESAWFEDRAAASPPPVALPYLVCISNLRPHKNLLLLLQAFNEVKQHLPHRLVVVGKAEGFRSTSPNIRAAIARLGDRLEFTGFQSDPVLRHCVSMADALVIPSLYEGFGLPALEAMAAGTPVIAARAAALPEVCGDCARYFDPVSVESLAEQLRQHAQASPASRAIGVARGCERARQFSWDKTADLTADAIRDALRNPGR